MDCAAASAVRGRRGRRWLCATPPHELEKCRRPPGKAAPCGRGQAGGDRLARLRPSRSKGLVTSRSLGRRVHGLLQHRLTAAVDCFPLDRHALSATGRGTRDAVDGLPSADPFFLPASEIKRPRALFEAQSTPISERVDLADLASGSQRPAIYSRIFDSECRARMRHGMSPHTNLALTWK